MLPSEIIGAVEQRLQSELGGVVKRLTRSLLQRAVLVHYADTIKPLFHLKYGISSDDQTSPLPTQGTGRGECRQSGARDSSASGLTVTKSHREQCERIVVPALKGTSIMS